MLKAMRTVRRLFAVGTLTSAVLTIGCGTSVYAGYRAYDPYRSDFYVWDANEGAFYTRWSIEPTATRTGITGGSGGTNNRNTGNGVTVNQTAGHAARER